MQNEFQFPESIIEVQSRVNDGESFIAVSFLYYIISFKLSSIK